MLVALPALATDATSATNTKAMTIGPLVSTTIQKRPAGSQSYLSGCL